MDKDEFKIQKFQISRYSKIKYIVYNLLFTEKAYT